VRASRRLTELLPSSGEASQMCPKISRVRVVGTVGVHLRPLVDEIPGFGAIIVTLLKPPKIRYHVNLGAALGGSVTAAPIVAFVDGLLPTILNGFLVWPERIVVPICDEKVIGPLEDYMLHHQGVLKVRVQTRHAHVYVICRVASRPTQRRLPVLGFA
jgi:hypothetical protein